MVVYATFVYAIPLFFMVSGYLLLGRNKIKIVYSIKKIISIWKYIICTIILYHGARLVWHLLRDQSLKIAITHFLESVVFDIPWSIMQRGEFYVYWYFGALMLVYMFYPLLTEVYKNKRWTYRFVGFLLCCNIIAFILNILFNFDESIRQPLRIWTWFFYFMLGGMLNRIDFNRVDSRVILVLLLGSYFMYISCYMWLFLNGTLISCYCDKWYGCPLVMIYTSCIFIIVNKLNKSSDLFGFIQTITPLTLPIYSYHIFFLFFSLNKFSPGVFLFLSTLALTATFALIVVRIPILKTMLRL